MSPRLKKLHFCVVKVHFLWNFDLIPPSLQLSKGVVKMLYVMLLTSDKLFQKCHSVNTLSVGIVTKRIVILIFVENPHFCKKDRFEMKTGE